MEPSSTDQKCAIAMTSALVEPVNNVAPQVGVCMAASYVLESGENAIFRSPGVLSRSYIRQ